MSELSVTTRPRKALVGASGIVGQAVTKCLVDEGWEVYGLSRSGGTSHHDARPVRANLGDPAGHATQDDRPQAEAHDPARSCSAGKESVDPAGEFESSSVTPPGKDAT